MSNGFVQTYLRTKGFFVSTTHRESSASISTPPWYYETIVWEWDNETKQRGKMLHTEDSGGCESIALGRHLEIVTLLHAKGIEALED